MKKFFLTLVTLFAFGFTMSLSAQDMQELPFDTAVVKGTLPNGLTYYIQHNENPKQRAFFYIAQKVGSVQEDDNQRGLAHFLEHMCFNGSEHFKGNGIVSFCQRIGVRFGAHLNAYTAADRTVYNIDNVPTTDPTNLDSCLYILYDWANGLTLDPAEIDKERGVIHEEWRMRTSGVMRVLERQLPKLMPGSKYGERLPIGLMSVVDNFKPQVLRDYYEKWYRPDLQGIIIVGDIDVKQMEQKVKQIFGKIPAQPNAAKFEYYPVPDNDKPIIIFDKDKEITTPSVSIMIKHDPLERQYRNTVAGLANLYIKQQISLMFNYRLQDLMQQADVPFSDISASDDQFILANTKDALSLDFTPKTGKDKEAFQVALRELMRIARYGFTEPEYKRAITDYTGKLDQAVEAHKTIRSGQLVQECVSNFLNNDAKPSFATEVEIDRQLAKILPLQAINQTIQGIIGKLDTNVVVLGLYPEKEGITVPNDNEISQLLTQTKTEQVAPYVAKVVDAKLLDKEPKAGKIKKELPADALGYKTLVLSNGIQVKYKQTDFDEGNILFSASRAGGWSKLQAKDMPNVDLLNDVMADNGLGKFNSNDLTQALTGRTVSVAPALNQYSENFGGRSSKKDLRTLFQLTYLYLTDVNYDTINYRKVYKEQEQQLANRNAEPLSAFQDSITTWLYDHSPYRQPMTSERLKQVSYDGILKIYRERFANPADFTFIFTGAFDEDSLRTFASQYLGALPAKAKGEKVTDTGVHFIKGMKQCDITKKMETPKCYILQVWNGTCPFTVKNQVLADALGDVLDMKYTETVREKYSFAYSTSSSAQSFRSYKDLFILQTIAPVKPEKCDSALLIIDQGLNEIATQGVNAEHMAKIKEQMLKTYETNQRENRYWNALERTLVVDKVNNHEGEREAIEALSSDQIKDFVNKIVLKQQNRLNVIILPEK